jgi:hypothetical protein
MAMVQAVECAAMVTVVSADSLRVKPLLGQDIRDRSSDIAVVASMVGVVEGGDLINMAVVLAGHIGNLTTKWHTVISDHILLHNETWGWMCMGMVLGREGLHSGTRGQQCLVRNSQGDQVHTQQSN